MPLLTDVEGDGANVVNQQCFRTKIAWDDEVVAKKTPDFLPPLIQRIAPPGHCPTCVSH